MEEKIITEAGGIVIEKYNLVNNHGIVFELDGDRYDARHWLNCYGADCNFWTVTKSVGGKVEEKIKELESRLNKRG